MGAPRRDLLAVLPDCELAGAAWARWRNAVRPGSQCDLPRGTGCSSIGSLPAAGVVFVVVALATVSFDGLSRTFWWFDLVGREPTGASGTYRARRTQHPRPDRRRRRASRGLRSSAPRPGHGGPGSRPAPCVLRRFVVSIVPIAFGYHFAHYLPSFLVDAQYALKALSNPLGRDWNLFGTTRSPCHCLLPHPPCIGRAALVRADQLRSWLRTWPRWWSCTVSPGSRESGRMAEIRERAPPHGADDRLHPVRSLAAVDACRGVRRPDLQITRGPKFARAVASRIGENSGHGAMGRRRSDLFAGGPQGRSPRIFHAVRTLARADSAYPCRRHAHFESPPPEMSLNSSGSRLNPDFEFRTGRSRRWLPVWKSIDLQLRLPAALYSARP